MKALKGTLIQEKTLIGAFFVIVKTDCETDGSFYSTIVRQGVRVANLVRELIIGIETVCDRRKPKYAINRTILDNNFHNS